jgi:hypothetical protein
VLDEQRVEGDPVRPWKDLPEPFFGFLGRPGADHPEAVRDAVHVRVDRDRRDAVPEDEDAVRRLRADAGERRELLERSRNLAGKAGEDRRRAGPDRSGLGVVEPGLPDERLDRPGGRARKPRRVGVPREEARARRVGRLVPRALGKDRTDEHLERVLGVIPQVRDPPVSGMVEVGESVEHRLPVECGGVGHPFRLLETAGGTVSGPSGVGRGPVPGSERSGSSLPP